MNETPQTEPPRPERQTPARKLRMVERPHAEKFNLWGEVRQYDVFDGDTLITTHRRKADAKDHVRGKAVVVPVGYLGAGKGFQVWRGASVQWFKTITEAREATQ